LFWHGFEYSTSRVLLFADAIRFSNFVTNFLRLSAALFKL